jgi:peptidylprolyl isomerase
MKLFLVLVLCGAVAAVAGCGHSDTTASDEPTIAEEAALSKAKETARDSGASNWTALEKVTGNDKSRLIIPSGSPPKKLVVQDLRVGEGRQARGGRLIWFRYVAFDYLTGEVQHQAWRFPFSATYRSGEMAKAVEIGLQGMRVGGIRELIAPSSLVYNEGALVYLIRLDKVEGKD